MPWRSITQPLHEVDDPERLRAADGLAIGLGGAIGEPVQDGLLLLALERWFAGYRPT